MPKTKRGADGETAKAAKKAAPPTKKKATAKKARVALARTATPRIEAPDGSIKVISVNVAGLRSVLAQEPKKAALKAIIEKESPDVLCIQEHKLQEAHVDNAREGIAELLPGYSQHWTCSTQKKGYAGVATFVK
jgi:endonuclease/exonuclease/phosphatase family metal-dependent hydrolase